MIDFLNLDDDIINLIINIRTDTLILEIYDLYKKIRKLEVLLKPLSIDKDLHTCKYKNMWSDYNLYIISYNKAYYCMTNFLYNQLNEKIILINNFNIDNGGVFSVYSESKILINPTYFEILVEFNKSLKVYHEDIYNIYLEGLQKIDKQKLNKFYRIRSKKDVTYYKFVTCF